MEPERKSRRYKGFEIHPASTRTGIVWCVRWHDEYDNACSLAPEYSSIAAAKRAINECIKHGTRPKRDTNRPMYMPFTSQRIG